MGNAASDLGDHAAAAEPNLEGIPGVEPLIATALAARSSNRLSLWW
jgi:hypothetical protein